MVFEAGGLVQEIHEIKSTGKIENQNPPRRHGGTEKSQNQKPFLDSHASTQAIDDFNTVEGGCATLILGFLAGQRLRIGDFSQDGWVACACGGWDVARLAAPGLIGQHGEGQGFFGLAGNAEIIGIA